MKPHHLTELQLPPHSLEGGKRYLIKTLPPPSSAGRKGGGASPEALGKRTHWFAGTPSGPLAQPCVSMAWEQGLGSLCRLSLRDSGMAGL